MEGDGKHERTHSPSMMSSGVRVACYREGEVETDVATAGVAGTLRTVSIVIEAFVFSARWREPSFYVGLFGPSLRVVLRRGITYTWGLQPRCGHVQKHH
jgi:hypothetical protein